MTMTTKTRSNAAKKAHDRIVAEMIAGGKQAVAIMRGEADPSTYRVHVPVDVDVKAVRQKTGLSQDAFAGVYGFATGTIRDWEQRRSVPDQAARAYLYVIGQKPEIVRKALCPLAHDEIARSARHIGIPSNAKVTGLVLAKGGYVQKTRSSKPRRPNARPTHRGGEHAKA
jgi:putative transcriptional regulator